MDLLSALLWSCPSSLRSSTETLITDAQSLMLDYPIINEQQREETISRILELKDRQLVKVDLKVYVNETTFNRWEAVVFQGAIYLRLPGLLLTGSKEGFMMLLDFAKDVLGLQNCVICVLKTRPDRANMLRTFMFMGFQLVSPNTILMPQEIANLEYIFLYYNME